MNDLRAMTGSRGSSPAGPRGHETRVIHN